MSALYDADLTQWLQLSGEHIVNVRPAAERADWVGFLIDEVTSHLSPAESAALLAELQAQVQARMDRAG